MSDERLTFSQVGTLYDRFLSTETDGDQFIRSMKKIEKICKNMRLIISDLQTLDINFSEDTSIIESQKDYDKGYIQAVRDILEKLYESDK